MLRRDSEVATLVMKSGGQLCDTHDDLKMEGRRKIVLVPNCLKFQIRKLIIFPTSDLTGDKWRKSKNFVCMKKFI